MLIVNAITIFRNPSTFRTGNDLGEIYKFLIWKVGEQGFGGQRKTPRNSIITCYNANDEPADKQRVLETFLQKDSSLRCVICTIAFGMGVDIPDVDQIIHYGPPTSVCSTSNITFRQTVH